MALKERARHKVIVASAGGTLVAPANESFRVTDIFCLPSTNDTVLSLLIEGRNVGRLRAKGRSGNHVPFPCAFTTAAYEATTGGLMAWLRARGLGWSYPVAKGETFTVSRYAEAGRVCLVYDAYDGDDVRPDELNGSAGKVQRYLHYLTNTAACTGTDAPLDTSLIHTGGDKWPVGAIEVPSGVEFDLLGILAAPVANGNGTATNLGYSTHLKLMHAGDTLMDDGNDGIPLMGDVLAVAAAASYKPIGSAIGPLTAEYPYPPLVFAEPLTFKPGSKLTCSLTVAGASAAGLTALFADVALLLEKRLTA